jgi:hypothetical protein
VFGAKIPIPDEARGATVNTEFRFDPATGELHYRSDAAALAPGRILGAWIQRGGAGEKGPVVYQILMRGERHGSGVIQLPPAEHARLREGRFYLAVYTVGSSRGDARAQITLPKSGE